MARIIFTAFYYHMKCRIHPNTACIQELIELARVCNYTFTSNVNGLIQTWWIFYY